MGVAYLVRHAKAGDRSDWSGDDRLRPLTKSGQRQAEALADMLEGEPIDKILSSGYLRCMQTVEPLGARRTLSVDPIKDLEEGARGDSVLRLVQNFHRLNVHLCALGPVMVELLGLRVAQGHVHVPCA